ncbi:hypothetical protein NG791_28230 [Laspinema sp. D1]|uniref:hypothetical protein n=1 Tax=Laspinema palackyanum TaxID=3231601 RepID=UPI00346BED6E|nr:hypothetical protein [Laspinema sp. D2b]
MQQLQLNLGTHFLADFAEVRGSHQGLYPEVLRLRRVWDAIASSALEYSRPEIPGKLGIGSRQFDSTVYWLVVLKLAEYQQNYLMPTERGRWLCKLPDTDRYSGTMRAFGSPQDNIL